MRLSDGEKLILIMLADIYEKLEISGEVDPSFVRTAIFNNYLFGLEWQYGSLFGGEQPADVIVKETVAVLDMWSSLEVAYEGFDEAEKARIGAEVPYFGGNVSFRGFDGNNEEHFGVADFLVRDMKRWKKLEGRDLNSHSESIDGYRMMLRVFEPIRRKLGDRRMTAEEVIAILNAEHPMAQVAR